MLAGCCLLCPSHIGPRATWNRPPAPGLPYGIHRRHHHRRIVAGPFYPSGHRNPVLALRGRLDECMMGLCRQLSADWPTGFLQVRVHA